MNDKDNVNYLLDSNNLTAKEKDKALFATAMKVDSLKPDPEFQDTDNNYVKSSEKLFEMVSASLDYFKKAAEISLRNEDKVPVVKILKEDYEKMKNDYEFVINENKKLKEKNKSLASQYSHKDQSRGSGERNNNSNRGGENGEPSNINVSKFIDSLMYLQTKKWRIRERK